MKRAHSYKCAGSHREVELLTRGFVYHCPTCGCPVRLLDVPGERFKVVAMHAAPAYTMAVH